MRMLFALLLLPGAWLPATGAPTTTAQGAIRLLPKDQAKNLVRIEARDGTPAPERWYIQVYDPAAENGLREFVVSQRELVASRTLSQFLDSATPSDVVGAKLVKVDSDDLIKIVQQYVEANNLTVAKINYTMLREAANPVPVWKLSCFDDTGKKLAEIVVNARNASVLSHEGFDLLPGQAPKPGAATPAPTTPSPSPSPQPGEPDVRPAIPVLPAIAITPSPSPALSAIPVASPAASASPVLSPTPKPKRPGLLQRMFGAKSSPTATPTPKTH